MTTRKRPRPAADRRLLDVFGLPGPVVEVLRGWNIRTVADVLAAARRQREARARSARHRRAAEPEKPFEARAEVALLIFNASFFKLDYAACRKAAAAILAAAEGGAQ